MRYVRAFALIVLLGFAGAATASASVPFAVPSGCTTTIVPHEVPNGGSPAMVPYATPHG